MDSPSPVLRTGLFAPGQRISVAVSGGADSVALLRRLLDERSRLGIVLSVVHVHHGIRGGEADDDAAFVGELAEAHDLPFHFRRVDAPVTAEGSGTGLEEAARNLRYAFFEELILDGRASSVATAHTLDDQAETVLFKLLRGAWTEGLSGIQPVLRIGEGSILRPFLESTHTAIKGWLRRLNQPWREDATNLDLHYTRNRIRHELLPLLYTFNPAISRQLSRLAVISADEEHYWQGELSRLLPSMLLPGRPIRGGGRSNSTRPEEAVIAIELLRLKQLHPAVRRRVLRSAARQLGSRPTFEQTERLLGLIDDSGGTRGKVSQNRGQRIELPARIVAERALRELRFTRLGPSDAIPQPGPEYPFSIPGEVAAPQFGIFLRGEAADAVEPCPAVLRTWRPGDRVSLLHNRTPKKVKEVLDRMGIRGSSRELWPVVEAWGKIVWMRGVEVQAPGFSFTTVPLDGRH